MTTHQRRSMPALRKPALSPFPFFFAIFLLVGFFTGHGLSSASQRSERLISFRMFPVNKPLQTVAPLTQHADQSLPVPGSVVVGSNRQENVLIIGVDQIEAAPPHLEALWLAMHLKNAFQWSFMPLYSPSDKQPAPAYVAAFELDENHLPSTKFLEELNKSDLWWNGYIIIDHDGLARLEDLAGGMPGSENTIIAGNQTTNSAMWADVKSQAKLIRGFCQQAAVLYITSQQLESLTPAHLLSNLEFEHLATLWQTTPGQPSDISCEFPSLGALLTIP